MNSTAYQYLKEIRYAFYTQSFKIKYFIIGNCSCDMDSTISAYLLSIGKNIRHKTMKIDDSNTVSIIPNCKALYLPVLNCKRGEISTRLDIKYVFQRFRIDEDDFFYIDDYELSAQAFNDPKNNYKVILVDHSILVPDEKYLAPYVAEIYDHHFTLQLEYPNLVKKSIKYPCGSCSTLILIDYFLTKFPHSIIPPLFAVTAILIDTENFKDVYYYNRWTEMDRMIYNHIISEIQSNIDLDKYFEEVFNAKLNEEENLKLGFEVLLTKDSQFFQWGNDTVQWSTLLVSLHKIIEVFSREKIVDFIKTFSTKRSYFICNSVIEDGNKETVVTSFKGDINLSEFTQFLKRRMGEKFIQAYYPSEKQKHIVRVELGKSASRKSTEPIFGEYFTQSVHGLVESKEKVTPQKVEPKTPQELKDPKKEEKKEEKKEGKKEGKK